MRKIINSTYISLDGVIENPHLWPPAGTDDGAGERIQTELLLACDAVLMGRRTYDAFAPVWPTRSGNACTASGSSPTRCSSMRCSTSCGSGCTRCDRERRP